MPPVQDKKYTPEQVQAINNARETNVSNGISAYSGAGSKPPINTVNMQDLVNAPITPEIPQPKVSTPPNTFVQNLQPAIQAGQDGIIRAQTEEARQRDDILGRLLKTETGSSQDIYNTAFNQAGGNETLKQLTDASTKLATLQGKFRTGEQAISGAKGQSKVLEGIQLNELDRQKAIEVGNQALVVQALQGNFESARQIAMDTSNFAIEDRKAELDNLYNQYNAIGSVVANQEAQLIDKERRKLDTLQNAVNSAISSGGASVEEMQKLTDPNLPDEQKTAIAQSVVARTTRQDRALETQAKNIQIATNQAQLDALKNPPVGTVDETTLKRIDGLSDTARNDLVNTNTTISQINRLKELIDESPDISTLTVATPEGREFQKIALDIADKMARKRTGAVVSDDEIKTFKKILGLSGFNRAISSDTEVLKTLDSVLGQHAQTKQLIDPTGEISSFLGQVQSSVPVEESYIDSIIPTIGGTSSLYSSFGL